VKNVERGPGWLIGVTTPGPRCAAPGKGSVQALISVVHSDCSAYSIDLEEINARVFMGAKLLSSTVPQPTKKPFDLPI
jgi:hypothetical protein